MYCILRVYISPFVWVRAVVLAIFVPSVRLLSLLMWCVSIGIHDLLHVRCIRCVRLTRFLSVRHIPSVDVLFGIYYIYYLRPVQQVRCGANILSLLCHLTCEWRAFFFRPPMPFVVSYVARVISGDGEVCVMSRSFTSSDSVVFFFFSCTRYATKN